MALKFETKTPNNLLKAFKKAIDEGHITTWSYDNDGDFTHTAKQWEKLAWLHPNPVKGECLELYIIRPKNKKISSEVYAIYHGRFVESMLAHFDSLFVDAIVTANPSDEDLV